MEGKTPLDSHRAQKMMMRKTTLVVSLVLLMVALVSAGEESIEQLKARAATATEGEQVKLFLEIAKRQLKAADGYYKAGDFDQGRTALEDIATSSEKAGEASLKTGKQLKELEIQLRKISKGLEDIRRSVDVDNRLPLKLTINKLEDIRTELLNKMFEKKKKS